MKHLKVFNEYILESVKSVQHIYDTYYSDINKVIFGKIRVLDPTSAWDKMGMYSKWLFKLHRDGNLPSEDHYKASEYLKLYHRFKHKLPLEQRNINNIKSLPELAKIIEPFEEPDSGLLTKTENKNKSFEKSFKNYDLYIPTTYEQSRDLGRGTKWCTAAGSKDAMVTFYNYLERGFLYILISKKDPTIKYQFHFEERQFMDKYDSSIKFYDFMDSNPDINEYFEQQIDTMLSYLDFKTFKKVNLDKYPNRDYYVKNGEIVMEYDRMMGKDCVNADYRKIWRVLTLESETNLYYSLQAAEPKMRSLLEKSLGIFPEEITYPDEIVKRLWVILRKDINEESISESVKSLDYIYNKYYKSELLPRDVFDEIIASDPTTKPNKLGVYCKWLLNLYENDKLMLEDLYKVTKYLKLYHRFKQELPVEQRDINGIEDLPELFSIIEPFEEPDSGLLSSTENKENAFVRSFKNYDLYIPKTYEQSRDLGRGATWCTAADSEKGIEHFNYYNSWGTLYVLINKEYPVIKYQLHFEKRQYMDKTDSPINLFALLDSNSDIKEYFKDRITNFLNYDTFQYEYCGTSILFHTNGEIMLMYNKITRDLTVNTKDVWDIFVGMNPGHTYENLIEDFKEDIKEKMSFFRNNHLEINKLILDVNAESKIRRNWKLFKLGISVSF